MPRRGEAVQYTRPRCRAILQAPPLRYGEPSVRPAFAYARRSAAFTVSVAPGVPRRAAISSFVGRSSSEPPASQPEQSASTTWRWNGDSGRVSAGGPVCERGRHLRVDRATPGAEKTTLSAPRPIRSPWRSGTFDARLDPRAVQERAVEAAAVLEEPAVAFLGHDRVVPADTVGLSMVMSFSSARPT